MFVRELIIYFLLKINKLVYFFINYLMKSCLWIDYEVIHKSIVT